MQPARLVILVVILGVAGRAVVGQPPPVVFEGLGLGDLSAAGSVSRALTAGTATRPPDGTTPTLDVFVQGPGAGRPLTEPFVAEIRSRIEGIHVAAGVQGDALAVGERAPRWTGRIGVGSTGPAGSESLELRTRVESRAGTGRLGVEFGPRIERRLPRGVRVFLDGAAMAEAVRPEPSAGWLFPGTSAADALTAVGVSARTGIVR